MERDANRLLVMEIVAARQSLGLTQSKLAELWGQPLHKVEAVETGQYRLDAIEFLHLCYLLDIDGVEIVRRISRLE